MKTRLWKTHARTHTHIPVLPHGVIWSLARGLSDKPVRTHDVRPLQTWAAVMRLSSSSSSHQKWNTVVVELFFNTPMIHTCSFHFPRMHLCMFHCTEVLALANIVSVDYSSFHWGNIRTQCVFVCVCVGVCLCVCVDCSNSNDLFFKCYCRASSSNTVLMFIVQPKVQFSV